MTTMGIVIGDVADEDRGRVPLVPVMMMMLLMQLLLMMMRRMTTTVMSRCGIRR